MSSAVATVVTITFEGGHATKQCQNPISCRHLPEFLFQGLKKRRAAKLKDRTLPIQ